MSGRRRKNGPVIIRHADGTKQVRSASSFARQRSSLALQTPCPTCGARAGKPCRIVKRGRTRDVGYHHPRRVREAAAIVAALARTQPTGRSESRDPRQ